MQYILKRDLLFANDEVAMIKTIFQKIIFFFVFFAFHSINKDWANRATSRQGHKAVVKKTKKAPEQTDDNIWKSKESHVPPPSRRGIGSGPLVKQGNKRETVSSAAKSKDTKAQDKNLIRQFMFISQTQPSTMVWGKSWKYNKSLPLDEGAGTMPQWGECWMFATHQPCTEEGKPWPNGPNLIDPQSLPLWKKCSSQVVGSQELESGLPNEEWQISWKKYYKYKSASVNGENDPKMGFFQSLVEAHRFNEVLCSSEWSDSWRSTKPASQQDHVTAPVDSPLIACITKREDKDREVNWDKSWKLMNHHGCNKAKLPQVPHAPEWVDSWRAAMTASNNCKDTASSVKHGHGDIYDDQCDQKKSDLMKAILMPLKQKYRALCLQLNELQACPEWSESWQVTKVDSKRCEEIEKVCSRLTLGVKPEAQRMEVNEKSNFSTPEIFNPGYEQLKYSVIHHSKREFTRPHLSDVKKIETSLSVSEWGHSWKTLKHKMRMEGRTLRPDFSRRFRESEKDKDPMTSTPEWKNSWKFTCQPLRQEPELWQQNWYAIPLPDRSRHQHHFMPVTLPKNGPTNEQSWGESWKFHGSAQVSKPGRHREQICHEGSSEPSYYPINHSGGMSASDWQDAWMVSETQFHHDKPSFIQWRRSIFKSDYQMEKLSMDNRVEIQPQSRNISWQKDKTMISQTFEKEMFRKQYPEKEWSKSWKAGTCHNFQQNYDPSSGLNGRIINSRTQQQNTSASENKSQWLLSFRLTNPICYVKQSWMESLPNSYHYTAIWSRGRNVPDKMKINTRFGDNPRIFKIWENSCCFLQWGSEKNKSKTKLNKLNDPLELIPRKTKSRRHFYPDDGKEKQLQKKWAGCHSLGKTQPNLRKGPMSVIRLKKEDETKNKFFEEWAQSWKFWIGSDSLKKQMSIKSLLGWDLSWKFHLPRYQMMSEHKAR